MLIIFLIVFVTSTNVLYAWAGSATLSWQPSTEPDLAGYNVYYGTSSSVFTHVIDVELTDSPNSPSHTINDLSEEQIYYFAVTAYDSADNQSSFSNEVSKYVPPGSIPPALGGGGCAIVIKDISGGSRQGEENVALDLLILILLFIMSKMRWIWKI
jgi:hypothetical protein